MTRLRWRDRRALREILGADAQVEPLFEIRGRLGQRALVFETAADGERLLLKQLDSDRAAAREAARLGVVSRLEGVAAPRLIGCYGKVFVQQYVQGETLETLRRRAQESPRDNAPVQNCCEATIDSLAALHSARDQVSGRLGLPVLFERERLRSTLRRSARKLEGAGLRAWSKRTGEDAGRWRGVVSDTLIDDVVATLQSTRESAEPLHADCHSANVLRSDEGRVYLVDWENMCWGLPWFDLARIVGVPEAADRTALIERYLDHRQRRGQLKGVAANRIEHALRMSEVVHALFFGRSLVHSMRTRRDAYFAERLTGVLERIARASQSGGNAA